MNSNCLKIISANLKVDFRFAGLMLALPFLKTSYTSLPKEEIHSLDGLMLQDEYSVLFQLFLFFSAKSQTGWRMFSLD